MPTFDVTTTDSVSVVDQLVLAGSVDVTTSDSVSVVDQLALAIARTSQFGDNVAITDSISRHASFGRQAVDTLAATDGVTPTATIAFEIASAYALTSTRVRVNFAAPALIDAALTQPTNYHLENLSPGSVDVLPLRVILPAGQSSPLYVDIDTTEHTDGANYEVALSAEIRGAAGQIGSAVPFGYTGIGVAPTLLVVIATSPTQVEVHFTEPIANNADANAILNYAWSGGLETLAVLSVIGEVVTLRTTPQTPGTLYSLTVHATLPILEVDISDDVDVDDSLSALPLYTYLVTIVGNLDELQTSPDAITWTLAPTTLQGPGGVYGIATGVGKYVIAGGNGVLVWPGLGQDWQYAALSFLPCQSVCYSDDLGLFVVGGFNEMFYSVDAAGWSNASVDLPSGTFIPRSIAWSPDLGLFVAVGGGTSPYIIETSPDGMTWTGRSHGGTFAGDWRGVCWSSGLGLFVAVGADDANDNVQTSPDGVTWTPRTLAGGFVGSLIACAAKNDLVIVAGYTTPGFASEWQTSPDGINWTQQIAPTAELANAATYREDLGLFVVVGNNGNIQTSPDGTTWTLRTTAGIPTAQLSGVL